VVRDVAAAVIGAGDVAALAGVAATAAATPPAASNSAVVALPTTVSVVDFGYAGPVAPGSAFADAAAVVAVPFVSTF
jgi:hypothetical protein